jgi:hypothetical protein
VSALSKHNSSTPGNSPDTITQDMINLLKALAYGDVSAARTDLVKFKADLKAQSAASASNNLAKDVTTLFKDLAAGNSSAAKADVTGVKADLQAQGTATISASAPSTQTVSPLDSLAAKLSDSLSSGAVQSALHDLAGYLVQNGQATGGLINTTG